MHIKLYDSAQKKRQKHRSSYFYDTLHTKLRMNGIDLLIITGAAWDCCVEKTISNSYHMD